MNDLMVRLAPKVASSFPVRNRESLESYAGRVRAALGKGQRAMIAARLVEASKELQREILPHKRAWIRAARDSFHPGERRPCSICGGYGGLTQAHHIVPLALQFEAGAIIALQNFVWLCPTHHIAAHAFINDLLSNRERTISGLPPEEGDQLHQLGVRFVELLTGLPNWQRVLR